MWTGPGTDVSAPAVRALSVTVGGAACGIVDVASSWATAQVSGLAALLFAEDETLRPAQVSTRIEATARGAIDDSALDGHGMIQPLEALTADLDIAKDGTLRRAPAYTAPRTRGEGPRAAAGHLGGVPADDAVVGDRCRRRPAARAAAAAADRAPAYLIPVRAARRRSRPRMTRSTDAARGDSMTAPTSVVGAVRVAEDRGFEPLRALTQHAFQASAIGH